MLEISEAASKNTLFQAKKIFARCWSLLARAAREHGETDECNL